VYPAIPGVHPGVHIRRSRIRFRLSGRQGGDGTNSGDDTGGSEERAFHGWLTVWRRRHCNIDEGSMNADQDALGTQAHGMCDPRHKRKRPRRGALVRERREVG
jgi:hypothetical protein